MMKERSRSRRREARHDPDPAALEIDQANDEMGGPTAASLDAGLSSKLEPGASPRERKPSKR
jgi:hypothetical protein